MADQDNNQQQQKKQQGDGLRIFISRPTGGEEVVVPSKKAGEYKITLRLGQNRKPPKDTIAVKVFANDDQIGDVVLVKEPRDVPIENVHLDTSQEITFSVRRIGVEKPDDSMPPINLKKVKKAVTSETQSRFDVIIGPLTGSHKNPVTFVTYDEKFEKAKGTVVFTLGQRANIDGTDVRADDVQTFETGDGTAGSSPLGMRSVVIKLKKEDLTVSFTHLESRQTVERSLLFEP